MKIKRILTATAAAALVITSVFAGGNFKEVPEKDYIRILGITKWRAAYKRIRWNTIWKL